MFMNVYYITSLHHTVLFTKYVASASHSTRQGMEEAEVLAMFQYLILFKSEAFRPTFVGHGHNVFRLLYGRKLYLKYLHK